jgi:hypothetical protein
VHWVELRDALSSLSPNQHHDLAMDCLRIPELDLDAMV